MKSLQPVGRATVDVERIQWADFDEAKKAIKSLSKININSHFKNTVTLNPIP